MAAVSILGWFPQSAQYMVLKRNTELEHTFTKHTTAEQTRILFSIATSAAKEPTAQEILKKLSLTHCRDQGLKVQVTLFYGPESL